MKRVPYGKQKTTNWKSVTLRALLYLGIALALLVPTYIAIASYATNRNAPEPITHATYDTITLIGPDSFVQEASTTSNTDLFRIFATLTDMQNSYEVIFIPETHKNGHYTATMHAEIETHLYHFYFLPGDSICYYTTPEEKHYRVDHELTTEFLSGAFAFELYDSATIPSLTTAATDEVVPYSVDWYYRTEDGHFTQHALAPATNERLTYPIANDISFIFSVPPTEHEIVIKRENTELYRGPSDGISLSLVDNEILDFEITAKYRESDELNYHGTLHYRFRMQVTEAAHFSLNTLSPHYGDILLMRCENVKNAAKLVIESTPALNVSPVIFRRGDYVYAAIPVLGNGAHRLKISYGSVSDVFDVTMQHTSTTQHTPDTSLLGGDWVAVLTHSLPLLIEQNASTVDSGLTPQGALRQPTGVKLFGFGDTISIPDAQLGNTPLCFDLYRTNGDVQALATGRVVATGDDFHLGKYVVVDHGCGLYTWYAGLSETRVVTGDILAAGDTLGLSGRVLYSENSVLIMTTIGTSAISTDRLR